MCWRKTCHGKSGASYSSILQGRWCNLRFMPTMLSRAVDKKKMTVYFDFCKTTPNTITKMNLYVSLCVVRVIWSRVHHYSKFHNFCSCFFSTHHIFWVHFLRTKRGWVYFKKMKQMMLFFINWKLKLHRFVVANVWSCPIKIEIFTIFRVCWLTFIWNFSNLLCTTKKKIADHKLYIGLYQWNQPI